jgi:hypothetical protein
MQYRESTQESRLTEPDRVGARQEENWGALGLEFNPVGPFCLSPEALSPVAAADFAPARDTPAGQP